jgi:hypothetical protein
VRRPPLKRALLIAGAVAAILIVAMLAWQAVRDPSARKPAASNLAAAPAANPVDPRIIEHINRDLPIPADFDSPQMRQLKRNALVGDAGAAFKLALFYDACVMHNKFLGRAASRPETAECLLAFDRWILIAAENGGSGAQRMLVPDSLESTQCEEVYRARFWFEKARRQGSRPGDTEYDEQLSSKEKSCGGGSAASPGAGGSP